MRCPAYLFWALLAVGQIPVLLHQWVSFPDLQRKPFIWGPPPAIAPQLDPIPVLARPSGVEASTLLQVTERPLFSPTRRPPAPPKAPPPAEPPDLLAAANLLGVYGEGERAGALVESEGRVHRGKQGNQVAGWTLKSADAQMARFERGAEVRDLRVVRQRSALAPMAKDAPAGSATTAAAAEQTKKDQDAVRDSVRQMNARRASIGLPPLPEP